MEGAKMSLMEKMMKGTIQTNISRILKLLVLIFVFVAVNSDASVQKVKDKDIAIAVENELIADEAVSAHLIDVGVVDGIVTLAGTVDNLLAKDRATKLARTVIGVRSVVNNIDVKPVKRSDSDLHSDVKSALLYDPAADEYEIEIGVSDRVVTLTGNVRSWQEYKLAEQVAKGVVGVKKVNNDLNVIYTKDRSDYEIEQEVRAKLENDVWIDGKDIDVMVDNGEVTLNGTVGNPYEKHRAKLAAWVAGTDSVDVRYLEVKPWERNKMSRQQRYFNVSDTKIKQAVKDALLFDPRTYEFKIEVEVEDNVVILIGKVDNLEAKRAAESDAENTVGVVRVKNHIKVRPEKLVANGELEERVKKAMIRDPYTEYFDIDVNAINGKVFLEGKVNTSFERIHAENVASKVNGVVEVVNLIDYKRKWVWKPDTDIHQDVNQHIFWSPYVDPDDVNVEVENGIVTLTGEVNSLRERIKAEENAYQGGAKDVVNKLRIVGEG
ncbi:MAG: BON domain-containing protein [candidate division Zixibacteria bacterium]|nr:BON domain-containing protein [candidate division Zixibacteria bacterium]